MMPQPRLQPARAARTADIGIPANWQVVWLVATTWPLPPYRHQEPQQQDIEAASGHRCCSWRH